MSKTSEFQINVWEIQFHFGECQNVLCMVQMLRFSMLWKVVFAFPLSICKSNFILEIEKTKIWIFFLYYSQNKLVAIPLAENRNKLSPNMWVWGDKTMYKTFWHSKNEIWFPKYWLEIQKFWKSINFIKKKSDHIWDWKKRRNCQIDLDLLGGLKLWHLKIFHWIYWNWNYFECFGPLCPCLHLPGI